MKYILHTFSLSLPIPLLTSRPCHLQISTGRHPINHTPDAQTISICHASPHPCITCAILNISWIIILIIIYFWNVHFIHAQLELDVCYGSTLSRLCRFSAFIAHVLVPYVNTLWTKVPKNLSFFMWYDAPRAVRIGDSSLNLAQAQLFGMMQLYI